MNSSNDTMQGTLNKATPAQLNYLAEFMRTHGDMASGFGQNLQGRVELERTWERLSWELNALGGSIKTAAKWKQTWRDLHNSDKGASHNRAQFSGCGPPTLNSVGPTEGQVPSVIGPVAVFGLEDVVVTEILPPPPAFMDAPTPEFVVVPGPSPTPTATPPPRRKRKRVTKSKVNFRTKMLRLKEEELRLRVEALEVKREKNKILNRFQLLLCDGKFKFWKLNNK